MDKLGTAIGMRSFIRIFLPAAVLFFASPAFAEINLNEKEAEAIRLRPVEEKMIQENDTTRVVSTADNHIFKVAKDRPIERTKGALGPIEMDSYIYFKFEKMEKYLETTLGRIESRLDRLEATIKLDPAVKRAIALEEEEKQKAEEAREEEERPQVLRAG